MAVTRLPDAQGFLHHLFVSSTPGSTAGTAGCAPRKNPRQLITSCLFVLGERYGRTQGTVHQM
nr:MAG TPA: hypothetical protein [Caudoviricetes sp.]